MITPTALTLDDVLRGTGGTLRGSAALGLRISSVSLDSRTVERGSLFVALAGQKHDGHDFVADALARGAAAALIERIPDGDVLTEEQAGPPLVLVPSTTRALRMLAEHWAQRHRAAIVAVTGSVGRRTTTELAAAVLRRRFGAIQASAARRPELSVPLAMLRVNQRTARIVLEVNPTTPSEVDQVFELARPSAVVVTNIEPTRREPEATLERVADVKAALVRALPRGGTAVLNADDRWTRAMADRLDGAALLFGLSPEAQVRAEGLVGHGVYGSTFDLAVARRRVHVRLPLLGLNSVHGALAAAAVGLADGLELREIGEGLQTALPSPRIIVATGVNGSRVIDDSYNANPESTLAALNLLAGLEGRKVAVLGDMLDLGRLEEVGHRKVGNRAALLVDELVTVGERARLIADEARRVRTRAVETYEVTTPEAAIDHLRRRLRPGDNVLIKGAAELALDSIVRAIRLES